MIPMRAMCFLVLVALRTLEPQVNFEMVPPSTLTRRIGGSFSWHWPFSTVRSSNSSCGIMPALYHKKLKIAGSRGIQSPFINPWMCWWPENSYFWEKDSFLTGAHWPPLHSVMDKGTSRGVPCWFTLVNTQVLLLSWINGLPASVVQQSGGPAISQVAQTSSGSTQQGWPFSLRQQEKLRTLAHRTFVFKVRRSPRSYSAASPQNLKPLSCNASMTRLSPRSKYAALCLFLTNGRSNSFCRLRSKVTMQGAVRMVSHKPGGIQKLVQH
jgi:hypothetical protein